MLLSSIKPTFFLTSSLIPDHPFPCRGSIYEQAADDIFSGVDGRTVTVTQAEREQNTGHTGLACGRFWQIWQLCNYWTTSANDMVINQVCNNRSSKTFWPSLNFQLYFVSSGEFYWTLRGELLRHVESGAPCQLTTAQDGRSERMCGGTAIGLRGAGFIPVHHDDPTLQAIKSLSCK